MSKDRIIWLFLSSTFRDFGEERDLLVKRVFPELGHHGLGSRAQLYFIGMLGERYGWVPPPDGYAADLLERQPWLKKHQGGKSVTELEILHCVLTSVSFFPASCR